MTEAEDLELLQRHEPRLNFTYGEMFFPMSAKSYVESADLLEGPTLRDAKVAIPAGSLTLESLAAAGDPPPGQAQFLRFTPRPLRSIELGRWRNRPDRQVFSAPGRLARVGLAARLVDAGLVLSLLARGRVPGGTAAAAQVRYDGIRAKDPTVVYHGRVIREDRWVILHYMFLYAMNDWRSTFEGANDHEADWEQCFVVLEQLDDGELKPAWFCAATHDEKGDDLRRRWDDPKFQTIDGHPNVFPGAGSHADYLEPGEYIMRLPFPGERYIHGPLDLLRRVWRDTLDQPDPGDLAEMAQARVQRPVRGLRARRRGQGRPRRGHRLDPDADRRRRPVGRPLSRPVGSRHRRPLRRRARPGRSEVHPDRRGPPVLARPARVRRPRQGRAAVAGGPGPRGAARGARQGACRGQGGDRDARGQPAAAGGRGRRRPHRARVSRSTGPRVWRSCGRGEAKLAASRTRMVELETAIAAGERRVTELRAGLVDDPRAHLHHAAVPEPPDVTKRRRLAETWAALSVGLLVASLAVIIWFRILSPVAAIVVLFGIYLAIESFFRKDVAKLILRLSLVLAGITMLILAVTFLRELLLVALGALGLLLIADNVGELRRRTTR